LNTEQIIFAEQIRLIHQPLLSGAIAGTLALAFGNYVFWGLVDPRILIAWSVLLLSSFIFRAVLWWRYRNRAGDHDSLRSWAHYLTLSFGLSGLFWGFGWSFASAMEAKADFALLIIAACALTPAVMTFTYQYVVAFYAFVSMQMLPLLISLLFLEQKFLPDALAFVIILYGGVLVFFSRKNNHDLKESIALRLAFAEQKQVAENAKDEADLANVAKSKFLAAASHDLRQPLHALALFCSTLDSHDLAPDSRQILSHIKASVSALDDLFHRLLDISKLDAGVLQPTITDFRIQDLLDRLITDYSAEARDKGLIVRNRPCRLLVRSDPAMLERIIRNFLSNAIRHTPTGRVLLGCRRDQGRVRIEVWDTGEGIAEPQQIEIFSEFTQLNNPERDRNKGLGLGLAIAKRLANILHHEIGVTSKIAKGSRFFVTVPLGDEVTFKPISTAVEPSNIHFQNIFAVIIDDEQPIQDAMKLLLETWGCQVLVAESGQDALKQLRYTTKAPDIILADYRLREHETGTQAIVVIQALYSQPIPALIITGDTAPERLQEAEASGYSVLHKPIKPAKLRASILAVLEQPRQLECS